MSFLVLCQSASLMLSGFFFLLMTPTNLFAAESAGPGELQFLATASRAYSFSGRPARILFAPAAALAAPCLLRAARYCGAAVSIWSLLGSCAINASVNWMVIAGSLA